MGKKETMCWTTLKRYAGFQKDMSTGFPHAQCVFIETYRNVFAWWPMVLQEVYPAYKKTSKSVYLILFKINFNKQYNF